MKLYFLRHGIAEEAAEWSGSDFDRPLTGEGRKRMTREAKALAELDLGLECIVTSPLTRAKQTAQIVAAAMKIEGRLTEDSRLGTAFGSQGLAGILQERAGASAIMLVGHEPAMSDTVARMIGGGRIDLKKGGLALVDVDDPSSLRGQLLWLLAPKVLIG